jgi:hypothetical protein
MSWSIWYISYSFNLILYITPSGHKYIDTKIIYNIGSYLNLVNSMVYIKKERKKEKVIKKKKKKNQTCLGL